MTQEESLGNHCRIPPPATTATTATPTATATAPAAATAAATATATGTGTATATATATATPTATAYCVLRTACCLLLTANCHCYCYCYCLLLLHGCCYCCCYGCYGCYCYCYFYYLLLCLTLHSSHTESSGASSVCLCAGYIIEAQVADLHDQNHGTGCRHKAVRVCQTVSLPYQSAFACPSFLADADTPLAGCEAGAVAPWILSSRGGWGQPSAGIRR